MEQWYWDSLQYSRNVRHRQLLKNWNLQYSRVGKAMWGPLSRWGGDPGLSVWSLQGIQTSFHFVILKMSLHLSLCRVIRPSFESGKLGVHFTWSREHRVSLTYIFLRENSSWGACRKLAYLFSQRQGISSHLQMIWGAQSFPRVALLKLMFL